MGGEWITYIPAGGSLPGSVSIRLSKVFTSKPPTDKGEVGNFGDATPLPLEIPVDVGVKLAEFIFLSYEVDRPGILQDIRYDFDARFKELVYVPVYYDRGYRIALRGYGGD